MKTRAKFGVMMVLLAAASTANAAVDSVKQLVDQTTATGGVSGASIYAVAYDPIHHTAYTSIMSLSNPTPRILKIDNVDTTSALSVSTLLTSSQLAEWETSGNPSRSPLTSGLQIGGWPQGLAFNPAPVGSVSSAYGGLWWTEYWNVTEADNTTNSPTATHRVIRYNMGSTAGLNTYSQLSTVLNPVVSKADKFIAAGQTPAVSGDNIQLIQPAFSPDGQSLYMSDAGSVGGTPLQGIYRMNPVGVGSTAISKLSNASVLFGGTELGIRKVGSVDRVFYVSSNNPNGLSYVDYNPSANTTSAENFTLDANTLRDFLEVDSAHSPTVSGITTDANGNVYLEVSYGGSNTIYATDPANGRLLRLDPQGRLSKLTTRAERSNVLGAPITTSLPTQSVTKLSTHTYTDPTAGSITRVVFRELNYGIAVANAYKPCDFNRDGLENSADMALLKSKLTANGITSSIDDARYDMNGNGAIDYKDVKILQGFYGFRNGDANLDRKVDTIDFNSLAGNFGKPTLAIWTEGDFDGNEAIDSTDFNTLAANYGQLPPSAPSLGSVVPEPASIGLLALGVILRRRR